MSCINNRNECTLVIQDGAVQHTLVHGNGCDGCAFFESGECPTVGGVEVCAAFVDDMVWVISNKKGDI